MLSEKSKVERNLVDYSRFQILQRARKCIFFCLKDLKKTKQNVTSEKKIKSSVLKFSQGRTPFSKKRCLLYIVLVDKNLTVKSK